MSVSSKIVGKGNCKNSQSVLYIPKAEDVVKYVDQNNFGKDYILLTMGAGDVYKIAKQLLK